MRKWMLSALVTMGVLTYATAAHAEDKKLKTWEFELETKTIFDQKKADTPLPFTAEFNPVINASETLSYRVVPGETTLQVDNRTPLAVKLTKDEHDNEWVKGEAQAGKNFTYMTKQRVFTSLVDYDYKQSVPIGNNGTYINPSPYIESDQEIVKKAAQTVKDNVKGSTNIYDYIRESYRYTATTLATPQSASEPEVELGAAYALTTKLGVADDYANVFVALLRANGISARPVHGFAVPTTWISGNMQLNPLHPNSFAQHTWTEVYVPTKGWIVIDPFQVGTKLSKVKVKDREVTVFTFDYRAMNDALPYAKQKETFYVPVLKGLTTKQLTQKQSDILTKTVNNFTDRHVITLPQTEANAALQTDIKGLMLQTPKYSSQPVPLVATETTMFNKTQPAMNVTFTVNDASLAKTENGMLMFTGKAGKLVVTATKQGFSKSVSVTIQPQFYFKTPLKVMLTPQTVEVIAIYPDKTTKVVDFTLQSSDATIATVSGQTVTFTGKQGAVTFSAEVAGTVYPIGTITVRPKLVLTKAIQFNREQTAYEAKLVYDNGIAKQTKIAIVSDNEQVVKASGNSVTFTGKEGRYTLTVRGDEQSQMTVSGFVTIRKVFKAVPYRQGEISLLASFLYPNGQQVEGETTYSSSHPAIATVTSDGKLRYTGEPGKVTITAKRQNYIASFTTTVKGTLSTNVRSLTYTTKPVAIIATMTLANKEKKEVKATYTSSNPNVATVSGDGTVKFTGETGSGYIIAVYNGTRISIPFYVNVKLQVAQTKVSDTTIQLSTMAIYPNGDKKSITPLYATSSNEIIVDENGLVTFLTNDVKATIIVKWGNAQTSIQVKR